MPHGITNVGISNLSMLLPRDIHLKAKATAALHGCPSIASYIAMLLESAPETITAQQLIQCYRIHMVVKGCRRRPS